MKRGRRLGRTALIWGSIAAAMAAFVLSGGILLSTRVEVHSTRDYRANRIWIINEPVQVCRYLHLTGVVELRQRIADLPPGPCRRLDSSWFGRGRHL